MDDGAALSTPSQRAPNESVQSQLSRLWGKIAALERVVTAMAEDDRVEREVQKRLRESRKGRWSLTEKLLGAAVALASVGTFALALYEGLH